MKADHVRMTPTMSFVQFASANLLVSGTNHLDVNII
jgi:hypothetical protein